MTHERGQYAKNVDIMPFVSKQAPVLQGVLGACRAEQLQTTEEQALGRCA